MTLFQVLFACGIPAFELDLDQISLTKSFSQKYLVWYRRFLSLFPLTTIKAREIVCEVVGSVNSCQRDPEREITLVTFLGILASRWFICGEVGIPNRSSSIQISSIQLIAKFFRNTWIMFEILVKKQLFILKFTMEMISKCWIKKCVKPQSQSSHWSSRESQRHCKLILLWRLKDQFFQCVKSYHMNRSCPF